MNKELGHRTFEKFKPSGPNMEAINNEYKLKLDEEIERIENEADEFREQLEVIFKKQVEKERKSTKKVIIIIFKLIFVQMFNMYQNLIF